MPQPSRVPAVQMFWHGPPLSRVERLCMASFVAHGHSVRLHVYDEPAGVPAGVTLVDAAGVLPRSHLTRSASGSFAIFADWFRYKLLYEQGGLWVDTDVVCLRPFDHAHDEIFAWQDERLINNAVLGLPRGHALARWMVEVCEQPNRPLPYDSSKTRWRKLRRRLHLGSERKLNTWGETGPAGITQAARHLGYAPRALPFWHFYPIHYLNWNAVFDSSLLDNPQFLAASYGVHLWNEMARLRPGFDKDARFSPDSLFEQLCARYLTNDN